MFIPTVRIAAITFVILLLSTSAFAQQNPHELFERARMLDESNQNLTEAIKLYGQVVSQANEQRALAARAQFRIGVLYARLGRKVEAQRAFQTVANQYADQTDLAQSARAKIPAAAKANPNARTKSAMKENTAMTVRQVWAGRGVDALGAPSLDGRYLSCVDWETGDLALRDLATGQMRRLTNKGPWTQSPEFALYSVPSPDGSQIAYTWFKNDFTLDLRVVRVDRGEPKTVYHNDEATYIQVSQWSMDGKQILAIISRKDRTNQIALISVANGAVRVLKTLDWRYPLKMTLSPDGRFIVYDFPPQEKSPNRDIFLLATDGSREIPLVQHAANDFFPVWTPDGKRIVFASDRTGTLGLWSLAVADGKPQGPAQLVKGDVGRMLPMGFTNSGALYYGLQTTMTDVYTATVDFSEGRILEPATPVSQRFVGSNSNPDWSPDGKYLSYVSQRSPGVAYGIPAPIIIRSLATGEEREILPATVTSSRPRWWPDGRAFVIAGVDAKGRKGIYKVDAQTGQATPLVQLEPSPAVTLAAWTSDGKRIFYTYPTEKGFVLRMRDLESGEEKELYRGNPRNLAISPDDQWLAFTEPTVPGLMILPVTGGAPRELLRLEPNDQFPDQNSVAWTRDGRYLLYTKSQRQQPASLWRIPAKGGEPERLGLTMEGLAGLNIHPDGRRLAFSAGQNRVEVWVMENFLHSAATRKAVVARR